ncbi:MAG TPA: hypothetical protein VK179_00895 [Bacteroidales bacterium]|nr:hypothetical protein [Bacteroidales bacterium]
MLYRKILKITGIFILILLGLVILIILSINTSPARKFIAKTINRKLESLEKPVTIGAINSLTLEHLSFSNILVHDNRDTIAFTGLVEIDWSFPALMKRKITVKNLKIQDVKLKLFQSDKQEPMNLVKAFEGKDTTKQDTAGKGSGAWTFNIGQVSVEAVDVQYNSIPAKTFARLRLKEAGINFNKIDLATKALEIPLIKLVQADAMLFTGNAPQKEADTTASFDFPWNIRVGEINIQNSSYKAGSYPDSSGTSFSPQFSITGFHSKLSGIIVKRDQAALTISETGFSLGNGFELRNFDGSLQSAMDKTNFNFNVESHNSDIDLQGSSDTILYAIAEKNSVSVLVLNDSRISLNDLLYFNPELKNASWFSRYGINPVRIDTKIERYGSVIRFDTLRIFQTNSLWLALSGHITNIQDSLKSKDFDVNLQSSLGNIALKGKVNTEEQTLFASVSFSRIRTSPVIEQQVLQEANGTFEADIRGFSSKTLQSVFDVNLDHVILNHHSYDRIRLNGNINPDTITVSTEVNDEGLQLGSLNQVNRNGTGMKVQSSGKFSITPVLLGLGKDSMTVNSAYAAGFRQTDDSLNASLDLNEIAITAPGTGTHLSSLHFDLKSDSMATTVNGNSDFFDISGYMESPVSNAGRIASGLSGYFRSLASNFFLDSAFILSGAPGARLDADIRYHPVIALVLKDTALRFSDASVQVVSDSMNSRFSANVTVNRIKAGSVLVNHFQTSFNDSSGLVNLRTRIDSISAESGLISAIEFSNNSDISTHNGKTHLIILKNQNEINTEITLASTLRHPELVVTFPTGELLLNGFAWRTDSTEQLVYNPSSAEFLPKITLFTDSSELKLAAIEERSLKGFTVNFNRVDLMSLIPSGLIPGNPSARINGLVEYLGNKENTDVKADLNLDHAGWSDIHLNAVKINGLYNSSGNGGYRMNVNANLDSAKLHAEGHGDSASGSVLSADITNVSLDLLKPFVKESLSELSGTVSGNIKSTSSGGKQSLDGIVKLDSVRARVAAFNSLFRIPGENISMSGGKIIFDRFKILDSLNNELLINGNLDISKPGAVNADLNISSPKLLVMNSTKEDNQSFYGRIVIGTGITVTGPLTSPNVQGKLTLKNGTEIFYANQPSYKLQDMNKTVTFINTGFPDSTEIKQNEPSAQANTVIGTTVEIDPETIIHFSMPDPMYNLKMDIQGGGLLNYSVTSTNQAALSGVYNISDGNADVKIKGWSNKNFKITDGSFIRWIDRMDDPEMQIEAQSAVTGKYKNPEDKSDRIVEFNVVLKLTNRLSALNVLFTVTTGDQYLMSVINSMSPEDQMKQAVSLLLFQTINIPGIYTSSNNVTDQVNQIVESQLNKLTQASIKNVDISLGVNSYTTPGQGGSEETQTSVSYNIKKNVFNDRATVEVSGRLNDYGQQGRNDNSLSNFTFEYRLDSAGTKNLHVYRQRSYEDILEGEVDRTGIGLIFRKTYDSISDIWRRRKGR